MNFWSPSLVLAVWLHEASAFAMAPTADTSPMSTLELAQRGRTCGDVSSCEEAVELWCGGYRGADRDKDGIPCENVCPSKALVDQIRAEIGC